MLGVAPGLKVDAPITDILSNAWLREVEQIN